MCRARCRTLKFCDLSVRGLAELARNRRSTRKHRLITKFKTKRPNSPLPNRPKSCTLQYCRYTFFFLFLSFRRRTPSGHAARQQQQQRRDPTAADRPAVRVPLHPGAAGHRSVRARSHRQTEQINGCGCGRGHVYNTTQLIMFFYNNYNRI